MEWSGEVREWSGEEGREWSGEELREWGGEVREWSGEGERVGVGTESTERTKVEEECNVNEHKGVRRCYRYPDTGTAYY